MAASAETVRQTFQETHNPLGERYAQSLGPIKLMGALARAAEESVEYQRQKEVVYDDFLFAVGEMIATDPEFRSSLDVDPSKKYRKIDGKIRAANGESMIDMVARGLASSRAAAQEDPDLEFQVVRDEGDKFNTERVDELKAGWTRISLSMDPKEAAQTVPKTVKKLGYEEDRMFLQVYSLGDDDFMEGMSHSVDYSDTELWREIIRDFFSVIIPEDISSDEWIRHGFEIEATATEAKQLLKGVVAEYYRRCGVTIARRSTSEFLQQNEEQLRKIFDAYYGSLSEAAHSAKGDEALSDLAAQILQTPAVGKLEPATRRQLLVVANSTNFDDESGRVMNSILRYIAVEELRKDLPAFIKGANVTKEAKAGVLLTGEFNYGIQSANIPAEVLHQRMAANFQTGIEAGRSYGGCPGQIRFTADTQQESLNPQGLYGRAGDEERRERSSMDETGKINCVKCGEPVDKKEATKIEGHLRCTHCNYEIETCTGREIHPSEPEASHPKKRILDIAPVVALEQKRLEKRRTVESQAA